MDKKEWTVRVTMNERKREEVEMSEKMSVKESRQNDIKELVWKLIQNVWR